MKKTIIACDNCGSTEPLFQKWISNLFVLKEDKGMNTFSSARGWTYVSYGDFCCGKCLGEFANKETYATELG